MYKSFLKIFRPFGKKQKTTIQDYCGDSPAIPRFEPSGDHLGQAAMKGQEAREAIKLGDYNKAWDLFTEVKEHYLQHAIKSDFNKVQTLALDSQTSMSLGNILRLENKHHQAFAHVLYWFIGGRGKTSEEQQQKLNAYFNRCKFEVLSLEDVYRFIGGNDGILEYPAIQMQVSKWKGTTVKEGLEA